MTLLKSRTFAVVVLLICVVGGTLLSAGRSLGNLKADVNAAFYEGSTSIANDLEERAITAGNLVVVAKRYLPEGNSYINAVESACQQLRDSQGAQASHEANEVLTDLVNALLTQVNTDEMTERDAALWRSLPADLLSRNDIIARNPYNQLAQEYNELVSGFPAGVLATVTGVGRAELYQ